MNEKTEKAGTGKLQSGTGIAKTEGSTAATCAQTSADADRASRTIPAAASRRLGAATALYALLYTICLYRNTSGITYPFFVAGTLYYSYYCTAKCRVPSDRDSLQKKLIRALPYGAAEFLLGISVFLTADLKIHLLTKGMLFGLTLLWALMLFCNTENWGLGDFIRNGWKGLFGTFSYLDTPFSDVAAALKAEEKQKENGKGHYILIGLVIGIPLLMVVAALLLSADAVFASLVSRFFGELAWSDAGACLSVCIRIYPWTPYQKPDREKTGVPWGATGCNYGAFSFNGNICGILYNSDCLSVFTGRDASGTDDMGTVCASGIFPAAGSLRD